LSIEVKDNPASNRFEAEVDGVLAVAEYHLSGGTITFTHTKVPEHHQGQGIGEALAHAALESARARHLSVVPQCAFIAAYIKRHPEFPDLVKE
jgi:predicted GNAT family acetyltransferase